MQKERVKSCNSNSDIKQKVEVRHATCTCYHRSHLLIYPNICAQIIGLVSLFFYWKDINIHTYLLRDNSHFEKHTSKEVSWKLLLFVSSFSDGFYLYWGCYRHYMAMSMIAECLSTHITMGNQGRTKCVQREFRLYWHFNCYSYLTIHKSQSVMMTNLHGRPFTSDTMTRSMWQWI